jgi:hypothetical protein
LHRAVSGYRETRSSKPTGRGKKPQTRLRSHWPRRSGSRGVWPHRFLRTARAYSNRISLKQCRFVCTPPIWINSGDATSSLIIGYIAIDRTTATYRVVRVIHGASRVVNWTVYERMGSARPAAQRDLWRCTVIPRRRGRRCSPT